MADALRDMPVVKQHQIVFQIIARLLVIGAGHRCDGIIFAKLEAGDAPKAKYTVCLPTARLAVDLDLARLLRQSCGWIRCACECEMRAACWVKCWRIQPRTSRDIGHAADLQPPNPVHHLDRFAN